VQGLPQELFENSEVVTANVNYKPGCDKAKKLGDLGRIAVTIQGS